MRKGMLLNVCLTIVISFGLNLYSQSQNATPNNLRVRTDSAGYLLASAAVQTPPYYTSTFNNTRLRTDSNGNLLVASSSGMAPVDAEYWVGAANGTLTAEKNLGALATALVVNTAGTPSAYTGTSCTNQFPRSLSALGAATCATVNLASGTDVTGALPIANGGTGAATQAAYTWFVNSTNGTAAPTWSTTPLGVVGTGTESFKIGGPIHTDMSVVGSTGGGAAVDAVTYNLPANSLTTNGQYLIVQATFTHAANTNSTSLWFKVNTTLMTGATCNVSGANPGFTMRVTRISDTTVAVNGFDNGCPSLTNEQQLITVSSLTSNQLPLIARIQAATTTNDIQTQSFSVAWYPTGT